MHSPLNGPGSPSIGENLKTQPSQWVAVAVSRLIVQLERQPVFGWLAMVLLKLFSLYEAMKQ
jgi:hypothetical protein